MSDAPPTDALFEQLRHELQPQNTPEIAAQATLEERLRCGGLVAAEIDGARAAGVPETSAAMRILQRLRGRVENG